MSARTDVRPAVLAAAAVLLAACSNETGGRDPVRTELPTPSTATSSGSTPETPPASTTAVPDTDRVLPGELIGTWASSAKTTEIVYRFLADGQYRSVEILSYPGPRGIFEFRRIQKGTARADGLRLRLRPSLSTRTRTDPEDPGGDYTDRPDPLTTRSMTWRIDGSKLHLTGADRLELVFDRQP